MKLLDRLVSTSLRVTLPAIAGGLLLTGCMTPGNNGVAFQDIYDIKKNQTDLAQQQASLERQITFSLNSMNESSQSRQDQMSALVSDIEKRMREQIEETRNLRAQLETLNFKLDAMEKRLGMSTGISIAPSAEGNNASPWAGSNSDATAGAAMPDPNAPTTTPTGIEQLISAATAAFNQQNYEASRDGFLQALAQNPTGSSRTEVLYWLAASYEKLKDNANASKYYQQVIREDNKSAKAWVSVEHLANIALQNQDRDYALAMLNMIAEQYPTYPDINRVKETIARIQQGDTSPRELPTGVPATR